MRYVPIVPVLILLLSSELARSMLWFPEAPNNLDDLDGLTNSNGVLYLRYNNGACADSLKQCNSRSSEHAGGHCKTGIHSFGSATSTDGVH